MQAKADLQPVRSETQLGAREPEAVPLKASGGSPGANGKQADNP